MLMPVLTEYFWTVGGLPALSVRVDCAIATTIIGDRGQVMSDDKVSSRSKLFQFKSSSGKTTFGNGD